MTPMLQLLANDPDEIFEFRSDKEAAALLLEANLLDRFAKNPNPGRSWFSLACIMGGTHFIVGVLYTGFPDAKDNGYLAHCFPRSRFTASQVIDWAVENYQGTCDPATIVQMLRPALDPSSN